MLARKKSFTSAIVGALVALSIIALVLSLVRVEDVMLPPTVKYGMVFDAGSSHTSLFVYEWDSDKENDTGVVSQTLSCDVQGQGISSYANNPPDAGNSLRECLDKALQVIPTEKQRDVPAYLGATAGMRLLREQNSSATEQVLAEVAKTMQEYPVAFKGARILTGEEEGVYGWITINYLLDSFTKESSPSTRVHHPCYPKGYKETVSLSSFRASPCTDGSDPRLPLGDSTVTLEGSGTASACLAALRRLFNSSACGQGQDCAFDGGHQPPLRGQFIAFSAFYYNFKFLNLTEGQPLAVVREAIEGLCTRSWEDLSSSYPTENPKRLPKYCANANYILTLLLDAYKFNETSWNNICFQMKVCQPEGCSVGPQLALWRVCGWGFRGDGLGERTQSAQSEVCPPESPSHHLITVLWHVTSPHHHISPPISSSSFSPGIKGLMLLSAFLETALSHQQKAWTPWVSG
ncbi:ectonucleoside triphosphate diphosphohydrolase 8-like isoform X3 [Haemorhous mexicanus]|uniref:ectonucleoside triphosphate diphosphohydrolase 8-like isoform X3 n=1 Tax=Haemorhous mexicanus TaxID=30427 RepID=UPI0028BD61B0|nr:ectonucleoside triphosphate diphosphohydrolase 8-like isoform X3 [Haemorhous mexicanus]